MSSIAHHLVSRSVDHFSRHGQTFEGSVKVHVPVWGFVVIGLTTVLFFLFAAAVSLSILWTTFTRLTGGIVDPLHIWRGRCYFGHHRDSHSNSNHSNRSGVRRGRCSPPGWRDQGFIGTGAPHCQGKTHNRETSNHHQAPSRASRALVSVPRSAHSLLLCHCFPQSDIHLHVATPKEPHHSLLGSRLCLGRSLPNQSSLEPYHHLGAKLEALVSSHRELPSREEGCSSDCDGRHR